MAICFLALFLLLGAYFALVQTRTSNSTLNAEGGGSGSTTPSFTNIIDHGVKTYVIQCLQTVAKITDCTQLGIGHQTQYYLADPTTQMVYFVDIPSEFPTAAAYEVLSQLCKVANRDNFICTLKDGTAWGLNQDSPFPAITQYSTLTQFDFSESQWLQLPARIIQSPSGT